MRDDTKNGCVADYGFACLHLQDATCRSSLSGCLIMLLFPDVVASPHEVNYFLVPLVCLHHVYSSLSRFSRVGIFWGRL